MNTEAEFKNELKELPRKYNAVMSGYIASDGFVKVNFYRCPEYNTDGNEIVGRINFNTRYMDGDGE